MLGIHGGQGEYYSVDAQGRIGRPEINMAPSGQWIALALVRRCNFGVVETIPFEHWAARLETTIKWAYKNGKPRYTLRDLDHGTVREWGQMVRCVCRA